MMCGNCEYVPLLTLEPSLMQSLVLYKACPPFLALVCVRELLHSAIRTCL